MPGIKVYSTPSCPYCVTLKEFLKDKGFEFEDIDVCGMMQSEKIWSKKAAKWECRWLILTGKLSWDLIKRKFVNY